jgi:hypothetical protein
VDTDANRGTARSDYDRAVDTGADRGASLDAMSTDEDRSAARSDYDRGVDTGTDRDAGLGDKLRGAVLGDEHHDTRSDYDRPRDLLPICGRRLQRQGAASAPTPYGVSRADEPLAA